MTKKTEDNDIDISFLEGVSKSNNFKIPADYFEALASEMNTKLKVKNQKSKKLIVVRTIVINLTIAAAVIIGVFVFKPSTTRSNQIVESEYKIYVSDFIESSLSEEDYDPFSEIGSPVSYQNEIAMLYAENSFSTSETTAADVISVFEEDWEDNYYEY